MGYGEHMCELWEEMSLEQMSAIEDRYSKTYTKIDFLKDFDTQDGLFVSKVEPKKVITTIWSRYHLRKLSNRKTIEEIEYTDFNYGQAYVNAALNDFYCSHKVIFIDDNGDTKILKDVVDYNKKVPRIEYNN
jgi:hypothetical protein